MVETLIFEKVERLLLDLHLHDGVVWDDQRERSHHHPAHEAIKHRGTAKLNLVLLSN